MNSLALAPTLLQINQWQRHFLELNRARTQAARELMLPRAQQVMDVLPLLLHLNHPRLPGYSHARVPTGIYRYQPNQRQIDALQRLVRDLRLERESTTAMAILGLYFMGSIGSVGQSRTSDLDVWLCHRENLAVDELKALQDKCTRIEEWALDQGVELHFFLMNLGQFRSGDNQKVDSESSGSSQHLLLLDEFYRSSVWIAGCMPRWWLIPHQHEHQADAVWQALVEKGWVSNSDWLDFGTIGDIPAEEFIGAGLWQLNKGLHDPYKSLLKLQLTRHYASQYPQSRPLCWDLKEQVQQGNVELLANDSYLLLLRRIGVQLIQEGNEKRIDLSRRAFYYKAQLPLSQLSNVQRKLWRTKVLQDLCESWGWDRMTLEALDERPNWSPKRIAQERNILVSEMLASYQYLLAFSQKNVAKLHISRQDMLSLGNRLYAAFDSRPGKIININPGISQSLTQEQAALRFQDGRWQLILGQHYGNTEPLKSSASLIELLCFAHLNNLIASHTRLAFQAPTTALSNFELRQLLSVINALPVLRPNNQTFLKPAESVYAYVLVNVATDPQRHLSRKGLQKLSNRDDSLGFSSARENLVHCIDLIRVNSWGEWHVEHYTGDGSLPHCLDSLLGSSWKGKEQHWPEIQVFCFCASRAQAIRLRVEQSITDLQEHFSQQAKSPYLMEVAESFYLFERQQQKIVLRVAEDIQQLLVLLQRPSKHYVHYQFDRTALEGSPLRLVYQHSKPGIWQVFYWLYDGYIFLYFLDEKGVLLHQQWEVEQGTQRVTYWLLPLLRFLSQLDQRWQRQTQRLSTRKITLGEIKRIPASYEFELVRRRIPDNIVLPTSIELRAVLETQDALTLYLNGQEYSSGEYGEQLFAIVTSQVKKLRSDNHEYPLFLTDLEITDNTNVIDHLKIRQRLQRRFAPAH